MNQLTLSGKPSPVTGSSSVVTPKTTVSLKPQEKHYTEEYLLKLIATDRYIFDIRCWQNGITKQEFFKQWNNGFSDDSSPYCDRDWWNAGHFAHVLRELKHAGAIDPGLVWQAFLEHKEKHLKEQAKDWKQNAEWEYRVASNAKTPEDCEQWLSHAKRCWGDRNACLRELGQPEEPVPADWSSAYPDPMYWGEPVDKKQEYKIKDKNQGGQNS